MSPRKTEDRDPLAAAAADEQANDGDAPGDEFVWPDLTPITPQLEPQAPYPLDSFPPVLGDALDAAATLSASSLATMGGALLGSLAALVQFDYDCQTLAPGRPAPTSLFFLTLSPSGWRKSTAFGRAFDPHVKADDRAEANHRRASAQSDDPDFTDDRKLRRYSPIALRDDVTIEPMLPRLKWGRFAQALASPEATAQLRGWMGQRSQRTRSMSKLSTLYDGAPTGVDRVNNGGQELRISGRRCGVMWMTQPDVGLEWAFSPESADGFAGRTLISLDDVRPDRLSLNEADRVACERDLLEFTDVVARVRKRQDEGGEYEAAEDDIGDRAVARLSADAGVELDDYYELCEQRSDGARESGNLHAAGFWARAPETAARLAANFAAFDWYRGSSGARDVYVEGDTILRAIQIADWYGCEWERLGGVAAATELARAATALSAAIAGYGGAVDNRGKPKYLTAGGFLSLGKLINRGNGVGQKTQNDPEFRQQVIAVLLNEGHIRYAPRDKGGHGGYEVHPDLAAGWGLS